MPHTRRQSKAVDPVAAQRLYDQLGSYRKVATALKTNYAAVYRALKPAPQIPANGIPRDPEHLSTDHPTASFRSNVAVEEEIPEPEADEPSSDEEVHPEFTTGVPPGFPEHLPTDHPSVPEGEPGAPTEPSAVTLIQHDAVNLSAPSGAPTAPTLPDTVEMIGEPWGAPSSAPLIQDLAARLDVVEAFIASLQRQPSQLTGPSHGAPQSVPAGAPMKTRKRGFVIAEVLSEVIDAYATAEHLQVKDVLDQGMREFFARRGWPVEEGER